MTMDLPIIAKFVIVIAACLATIKAVHKLPLGWAYIVTTYYAGLCMADVIAKHFLFPYLNSPRRFYAGLVGNSGRDGWKPPTFILQFLATNSLLFLLIFAVSFLTVKLVSYKRCGMDNPTVNTHYAYRMTFIAMLLHVFFTFCPVLTTPLRILPLPFVKEMATGIPVGVLCSIIFVWIYEAKIVKDVCGKTLDKNHFYKDIA